MSMTTFKSLEKPPAFFMPCDDVTVIDGTESTADIRLINHTCSESANCKAITMTLLTEAVETKEVVIVAIRNLCPQERLSIEYSNLNKYFKLVIKCTCEQCKGRKKKLNFK